jgi:hypothetical protein
MSVMVEMWVRGHRERIDTALWKFEESLAGAVRTGDRWLGNPDDQGLVQGWFKVEITDVNNESAACEAIRRALTSADEGVVFGGPCLPEIEVPERE